MKRRCNTPAYGALAARTGRALRRQASRSCGPVMGRAGMRPSAGFARRTAAGDLDRAVARAQGRRWWAGRRRRLASSPPLEDGSEPRVRHDSGPFAPRDGRRVRGRRARGSRGVERQGCAPATSKRLRAWACRDEAQPQPQPVSGRESVGRYPDVHTVLGGLADGSPAVSRSSER